MRKMKVGELTVLGLIAFAMVCQSPKKETQGDSVAVANA